MSYQTLEVELDHGRVLPQKAETLPLKARALLTILDPRTPETPETSHPPLAALAAEFCGIGNGTHTDLSTNKEHLNDLGR